MTERPLPVINELNKPFYDALSEHELRLQRCRACGHLRYPIARVCPQCLDVEADWELLSGRASVHATVVFHQRYSEAFADQLPYNVSIVELEEGPRMMTNVIGVAADQVRVGDDVSFVATRIGEGVFLPQFMPAT